MRIAAAALCLIAYTAQAETVALSTSDCTKLVEHVPADDVTYKPGVDVHGKPVVPADLGDASAITMPEEINIQIGIDLADRLALRDAKRAGANPGVPGATTGVTRKVMPYSGIGQVGVLSIKGNDAFWNGERIAPQDQLLLAEACRKGLTAAGVTLPDHKPNPSKP